MEAGARALRAELEALRAELALVRKAHADARRLRSAGGEGVPLLAQGEEWAALAQDDSDDEAENGCRSTRHAQHTFQARERRLTLGADALERHAMIGDADVEVHTQGKEWQHESDSEDDSTCSEQGKRRHAANAFRQRERRLTLGEQAILRDRPQGDKDVDLVPEGSEWAHHEGDSSDDEGTSERFAEGVHRRRERRLTHGASVRELEVTMGDAEVQVVAEGAEWAGAEENSDDEGDGQALQRWHSEVFRKRERRLTLGEKELQAERSIGDLDVEVLAQETEWAGCEDGGDSEEEGEDAQRRHADNTCRSRERRLTFVAEALKGDRPIGDLEVPVVAHSAEWGALEGEDEEDEDDFERSHTERSRARERRLTEGEEALKRFASPGDADAKEPQQEELDC